MDTTLILNKLIKKENLTSSEAENFFSAVLSGQLDDVQIAGIIIALRVKGEISDEVVGFIRAMRDQMVRIEADSAIDVCGTGGDGKNTFNISTAVAFVACGAGISVAKHGSRAVSGKCGSADVLEALGVNTQLQKEQAEEVFKKTGMVFLLALLYHPAMKYVAGIRKSLGVRTVFNMIGPFSNPASVKRQLIGVFDQKAASVLANAAISLNYEHLIIVNSSDGMDEISIFAPSDIYEIKGKKLIKKRVDPSDFGFSKGDIAEIAGGTVARNAELIKQILDGEKGFRRDIVVLNSAYALYVGGKVKNIKEGIMLAERSIDSGAAKKVLEKLVKETQRYGK